MPEQECSYCGNSLPEAHLDIIGDEYRLYICGRCLYIIRNPHSRQAEMEPLTLQQIHKWEKHLAEFGNQLEGIKVQHTSIYIEARYYIQAIMTFLSDQEKKLTAKPEPKPKRFKKVKKPNRGIFDPKFERETWKLIHRYRDPGAALQLLDVFSRIEKLDNIRFYLMVESFTDLVETLQQKKNKTRPPDPDPGDPPDMVA